MNMHCLEKFTAVNAERHISTEIEKAVHTGYAVNMMLMHRTAKTEAYRKAKSIWLLSVCVTNCGTITKLSLYHFKQHLKLKKYSGQTQVMDIHKEIAKFREQTHVLARLKTKGFLDEAKYIEQTNELTAKINKLQTELKKLTRFDDEDETLDQIEMLIDFFEKRENPMTEFEESAFESIVEKIVVIDQHELEFHLIGGIKFKENI